jgi:predicted dehydrogenase
MNVGLIGCGGIAPSHLKAYKILKDVKVVAVCDLNIERAKYLANRYNIKNVFGNYWDMLDKVNLDLVDVCTPVSTHAKIICDIAHAVPAILVEKPMALNTSECDEIIKKVGKYKTKLCVGHTQIFSPKIKKAKELIESGKFNLYCFKTTQKESFEILNKHNLAPAWNVSPEQKGIIWEVCCHLAYLQLYFLPDIKEVYAVGGKVKYPVFDDFAVLLRTTRQHFGIIELSWVSKETEIIYELRDFDGKRLEIYRDFDYMVEKSEYPPLTIKNVLKNFFVEEKRVLQKWFRFGVCFLRKRRLLPIFNMISSYVEAIKKDLPPPISPEEGRNTINLLESIEKSLLEQRPVLVDTIKR